MLVATFPDVHVVLLHAAWPFSRTTGYMASLHACFHADFGLVVPLLLRTGIRRALEDFIERAPTRKVL